MQEQIMKMVNGDITFLNNLYEEELEKLLRNIRTTSWKDKVIKGSYTKLKKYFPICLYQLVYDMDEYQEFCVAFLKKNFSYLERKDFLLAYFLGKNSWYREFIKNNLQRFMHLNERALYSLLQYLLLEEDNEMLEMFLYTNNLDLRGKIMSLFMRLNYSKFRDYYGNLFDFFVKTNNEGKIIKRMNEKFISEMAYNLLDLDIELYEQVKDYILNHYSFNSLAEWLDGQVRRLNFEKNNTNNEKSYATKPYLDFLIHDIDVLFQTSKCYKYSLYTKYYNEINEKLREEFYNAIKEYELIDKDILEYMFKRGFGYKFLKYTKKYMELSTKSKIIGNAGIGSCTRSFIVGDYVVKCSYKKWYSSRCPDLFLIAKNYEEDFIRDEYKRITGAIEVQKYYSRFLRAEQTELIEKFLFELNKLGYALDDNIFGENNTPNIFYLDSYLDADCANPEELPEWFKKDPIVLVDRDFVRKVL